MQYLNVLVNAKTNKINHTFTYTVTPELLLGIRPGVLVEVPFGNRMKEGVVLSLKHLNTETSKHKLKNINKIIDPAPIIDSVRLQLAKWMSRYYLTSLAKVIFFMVPEVARREVKRITNYELRITNQRNVIPSEVEESLIKKERDFSTELRSSRNDKQNKIFGLYNSKKNRIQNYIQLIQKARDKNKGVILLFPDWLANQKYIDTIYERFSNNVVLLNPHKTKTEFFRSWNKLRLGEKTIAIGTRNSIFAPVNNLGLIIIDESEDFGYKEEQTVHYHVREVSKYLARIAGANLIYSSSVIQLEDYYWQKFKKIKVLKHSDVRKNVGMFNKILLVDGSQEKSLMGYQIEQKITKALAKKQKILIFTNRKSQGFLCADCGYIFRCPRCNNVLQYQTNNLKCSKCNHQENSPAQCPSCHGYNLRSFGTSIESIKKEIQKLFPSVVIPDRKSFKDTSGQESSIGRFPMSERYTSDSRITHGENIVIATKEILWHPEARFGLVVVPSWEHLQFGEDFNQKQSIINTIVKLLEITDQKLIIQTKNLENRFLKNITLGKIEEIYQEELREREKYQYPPFYKFVKFIYKHKDPKIAGKEINKLDYKLRKLLPRIEILGPFERRKLRDKIYWQLILKIPTKLYPQVNKLIISQEKELSLSKYLIDVNPLKLL